MNPERMAAIHAACFTDAPTPWKKDEFRALLAIASVFAVETSSGLALGRIAAGEGELLTLAVHPSAQGRGQGRTLLEMFETQAVARDAQEVFLEVAASNDAARALYSSSGYRRAGLRPLYYAGRIDALILRKEFG